MLGTRMEYLKTVVCSLFPITDPWLNECHAQQLMMERSGVHIPRTKSNEFTYRKRLCVNSPTGGCSPSKLPVSTYCVVYMTKVVKKFKLYRSN